MMVHQKLFLLVVCFLKDVMLEAVTDEYCIWEAFQPRCSQNEIIVINEAVYGRRKLGRCLMDEGTPSETFLEDPKFLGCFVDVRHILEPLCAGKNHCDVNVVKIKTETPCHKFYKLYLEVGFSCLQVVQENRQCSISVSTDKLHLSTSFSSKEGCGSERRPWILETLPGQRIRISLLPYITNNQNTSVSNNEVVQFKSGQLNEEMKSYGRVVDKSSKKSAWIGLGSHSPNKESYSSDSNSVEITINPRTTGHGLIIVIEATGCSDLIPPADAWLKRTENEATIGCYSTRLRWQLKCQGQRWIGVIGNCSQGHPVITDEFGVSSTKESSKEAAVVPIVAIAMTGFVICFLIICVGVVFINRYYAINKTKIIKHMNNDLPRYEYNNGSLCYGTAKNFPNGNIQDNSGLLSVPQYHDSAHYFELDQSLVSKDVDMNKT